LRFTRIDPSFQDAVLALFRSKKHREDESFWALRYINFTVESGEMLGIIGSNGSGKSTLFKLLSRIINPSSGKVTVSGRVSALLELGAGFQPELSGRENIFLYGSVLGISREEMNARLPEIISFAELERFIDVPVKFYSSGMYVRLAFAVAINVQAEILLIDEVLAVGDRAFQDKCLDRIASLHHQGVTILLISHDLDSIRRLCSRVIWLNKGEVRMDGPANQVVNEYLAFVYATEEAKALNKKAVNQSQDSAAGLLAEADDAELPVDAGLVDSHHATKRWGSREAEITDVVLLDEQGNERLTVTTGEPLTIVIRYQAHQTIENPVFGVLIVRNDGILMSGSNTSMAHYQLDTISGAGEVHYHIAKLPLLEGRFSITAAIHNQDETKVYDYHQSSYPFSVHLGDVRERYGMLYMTDAHWSHCGSDVHAQ